MNFIIREADKIDAEKILEYFKIVGGQTDNLSMGSEGLPYNVKQEMDMLERSKNNDTSTFLLATIDNEIIGIGNISGKINKRSSHRATLVISVRKGYWNQGIGSELMKKLIDFSKKADLKIIDLTVRSDNDRAISLYKKFGFEKTGIIPAFIQIDDKYFDADYMILDLRYKSL
ncbi:GNAT family N-acetyltransferase [uncultured Anaerococcus sp.]|uniref:GNAT family N-acetyltransferase n=1 Tax=uncultured Anaerococcus sp. TaxID=293428 RepID=UPI00263894C1|nr:GNAT family N-acetyltransferase [uncultured Anaerococcus sp.]